jgi:hypothetical protein
MPHDATEANKCTPQGRRGKQEKKKGGGQWVRGKGTKEGSPRGRMYAYLALKVLCPV